MPPVSPHTPPEKTLDEHGLRLLIDSVTDYAIYMLDPSGHVVRWSQGGMRIKQYTAEEIIGRSHEVFYTEEDRATGMPQRVLDMARRDGRYEATGWHRRKDGTRFLADSIVQPIRNADGTFMGFAAITRDITERRFAEQQIREGAMFKALVNTAVDSVMMIDSAGIVQMANPATEKLFGYRAEEMVGRNVSMLMPAPYHAAHDGYLKNYKKTGTAKIIGIGREVVGQRKDGSTFPMCLSIGEAKQEGAESIFVGIMHDLSDRKRTEEQLAQAQKMEAIGQLSGGIAHDFNNLLTVIIGNADLLCESLQARADLKQLCETIVGAGERGAELTRRLLAFGRRQTLQPVAVDCSKLIEGFKIILRRTLSEDIDIRISSDPALSRAFTDAPQLETALLNLTVNARDAMPLGGHLHINLSNAFLDEDYRSTHPEVKPGHYVMIAVTDDGEGMPAKVRERVFEPFFTTKEVGKGTGLGLSMVYGFIKQSDGHIAIYSEPGLGTTVRLYLPVAEATAITSDIVHPADPTTLHGSETVLVAEDDPFVRSHAIASLESLGYHVITAANGMEALAKLREDFSIDVLFSDVVMPGGMTGWELADQAQKLRPGIKILLTSGYPTETLTARGRHNPELPLLNKPYRKTELGRRLREILDNHETARATADIIHISQATTGAASSI